MPIYGDQQRKKKVQRERTFRFVNLAFRCTRFKGNTRLILLSLADRADVTGLCWCGYEDIMRRANCKRTSVSAGLDELRNTFVDGKPLLEVKRRYSQCSRYRLSREVLTALAHPERANSVQESQQAPSDAEWEENFGPPDSPKPKMAEATRESVIEQ